jgi:hypothetical protein
VTEDLDDQMCPDLAAEISADNEVCISGTRGEREGIQIRRHDPTKELEIVIQIMVQ